MREIKIDEYEKLRGEGNKLIGRVIPKENPLDVIYYSIEKEQQSYCPAEILDTLFITHPTLKGQFDVIRHWTSPENKSVTYNI